MKQIILCSFICILLFFNVFSYVPIACYDKILEDDSRISESHNQTLFRIVRDGWGIAHVFAETDYGAFQGAGYATAQDRMYQMHRNRRAVQGRLAEFQGDQRIFSENQIHSIIEQDKYMRYIGFYRYAEQVAQNLNEKTQQALEAYSSGINKYINDTKDQLIFLFDGEIPEQWTPVDCIAIWDRFGDYFSSFPKSEVKQLHLFEELVDRIGYENAILEMTKKRIVDNSAATVCYEDFDAETIQAIFNYANNNTNPPSGSSLFYELPEIPKMSHAWVIGGNKSDSGSAILHSDPQTKVSIPSIWYEIHIQGETFDARGIGIAGCPGFLVGWNRDVAWGATALGADQSDLYRLEMVDVNKYKYDNTTHTMNISDDIIKVKAGRELPVQIKKTILGPVVTDLLDDVYPGEEYVLVALPQWDKRNHSVEALIEMLDSNDVFSFHSSIQTYRTPSIHCIFGDSKGNIGYSVMAGIPLRSLKSPMAGSIAQNGSSSQYAWVELVPYAVLPHVFNPDSGLLFTANHLPVGDWYPIPLHLGTGGTGDTSRSWRLRELLVETGKTLFTYEDVFLIHYDDVDPQRRSIVEIGLYLRDAQGVPLSRSANDALNHLEAWLNNGAHCDVSEPFYAAAHHMNLYFRDDQWSLLTSVYGSGNGGLCYFLKKMISQIKDDTQYLFNESEIEFFDFVLASGYNTAIYLYGDNPNDWMEKFRKHGPGKLSIEFFNTLEDFGSIDPALDKTYYIQKVNGDCIGGQMGHSYSQSVNLADIDSSKAILPVGISEDPSNQHFLDQENIWLNLIMRSAPLLESAIDYESPQITILSPTNALYVFNVRLIPLPMPWILGSHTIEVDASDESSGVNRVEFYIDEELKSVTLIEPFNYRWNEFGRGKFNIEIIAFDNGGNHKKEKITLMKIV